MMKPIFLALLMIFFAASCDKSADGMSAAEGSGNTGTGGSLAKFTINGNYLYTVQSNFLHVYDISSAADPLLLRTINLNNSDVETIYCYGTHLFFGTQTGMLIYDISNPDIPVYTSTYAHIRSCDPVVVSGQYAWVTLSTGNVCGRGLNQLELIDISDIRYPQLQRVYSFSRPRGLAVQGDYLYLCDEVSGFKVLDISKPMSARVVHELPELRAFDVIAKNGILTITSKDGVYQYDCSDPLNLKRLSKVPVQ